MREFGKLRRYLTLPRRAGHIERDVDEELRAHIALRVEALEKQGYSAKDAHEIALKDFGDLDEAARYCAAVDKEAERRRRVYDWVGELAQDARHALRLLRRAPTFTAATVLTLGVALGASVSVYSVLHAYLIRPLPFPESHRLVWINPPAATRTPTRGPSLEHMRWDGIDSLFAYTMAWDLDGFTLTGEPFAETLTGAWISKDYVPALGVQTSLGRVFRAEEYVERAPVAIISHRLWQRRFGGDSTVIGRTISMHSVDNPDASSRVTVVGVLPTDFWPIHWRESELLRPFAPRDWMPVLARLKPDVSMRQAEQRLDVLVRAQLTEPVDTAWHMRLVPALEQHSQRVRPLLRAILGAALFMLLAASGSVAGALVSRTATRRREIAIRLALGGSRLRILRQLLTESVVLAVLADAVGVVVAFLVLRGGAEAIQRLLETTIPGGLAALLPDVSVIGILVGASVVVGVALGMLPALTVLLSRGRRSHVALVGGGRSSVDRGLGLVVRRGLVAGQVVVAMVLLFGAGLMLRSIAQIDALELGFQPERVLKASMLIPDETYSDSAQKRLLVTRLLARVRETEGVRSSAAVFPYPFRGGAGSFPVLTEGASLDEASAPRGEIHTVTPGYFETMGIPLRAGRDFHASDDHAAPLAVVISERLARRIAPRGSAIGRRIRVRVPYLANYTDEDARPWRTVVGVVGDARDDFALDDPADVYVPYAQNPRSAIGIVVQSRGDVREIMDPVRRAVTSVDPALALSGVGSMADVVAEEGGQRRGLTALLGAFALFSLGLSALALYASLSYMVVERRSELALRMAVGASAVSILRLVLREGLLTTVIGLVVGAAASLALGRVLGNQLYGVAPTDPATLASIALVLSATVVAACVIPSTRAARTDPALTLRE